MKFHDAMVAAVLLLGIAATTIIAWLSRSLGQAENKLEQTKLEAAHDKEALRVAKEDDDDLTRDARAAVGDERKS